MAPTRVSVSINHQFWYFLLTYTLQTADSLDVHVLGAIAEDPWHQEKLVSIHQPHVQDGKTADLALYHHDGGQTAIITIARDYHLGWLILLHCC